MKKILFVGITALAMASCTHDDYAPVSKQEQYQAVFEKEFGAVNPNVNWGFTPQQVFTFDKDGKLIGTRGHDANANDWYKYLTVPAALTDAQKEVVRKWFQNNPNPKGLEVNWSDFFVQQVYKGGTNTEGSKSLETYDILKEDDTPTGSKVTGSNQMDWLHCGNNSNVGEHINNFNNGNASETNVGEGNNKFHKDRIMYMKDYNTTCFGFYDSYGSKYYDDSYVLISGDQIDPSVAGMYFVGFDYKMQKYDNGNIEVRPDGYYSDWIVRIAPGLNAPGAAKRVMVEDIIDSDLKSVQTSDWDFNDAVFDVKFETSWVNGTPENNYQDGHNQKYAIITLHAAGGTKYLTIGGQGDKGVEVHEALCVEEQGTMVNTGNGATRPVAIFRIPVADNVNNANDIPVYVGTQELTAQQGEATQKLCVPTDVKWMKERVQFINSYDQFKGYVNSNTPDNWYESVKNLGNLY
ncbi:hypothetical protein I6E23_00890 [Prevotella brevis]|nr:hypothetical protein [Xylanibacter brevis]